MTKNNKNMIALGLVFAGLCYSIDISPLFGERFGESPTHLIYDDGFAKAQLKYSPNGKGLAGYCLICKGHGQLYSHDAFFSWHSKKAPYYYHKDNIHCKNDGETFPLRLPKFSKACDQVLHSFDKIMRNGGQQQFEAFFSMNTKYHSGFDDDYVHNYGYLFYAKDKESCYKKFAEIFGQAALIKFTTPVPQFISAPTK